MAEQKKQKVKFYTQIEFADADTGEIIPKWKVGDTKEYYVTKINNLITFSNYGENGKIKTITKFVRRTRQQAICFGK